MKQHLGAKKIEQKNCSSIVTSLSLQISAIKHSQKKLQGQHQITDQLNRNKPFKLSMYGYFS